MLLASNKSGPVMLLKKTFYRTWNSSPQGRILRPKVSVVPRLRPPAVAPLHCRVSISEQDPAELTVSLAEGSSRDGGSAHRTWDTTQAPCPFLVESNRTGNALLILKIAPFRTLN